METKIFSGSMEAPAEIIRSGGLVAVPTETVYGLAGNGLDEDAVKKIYEVKGRPEKKPLSLMVGGVEAIDEYCVEAPAAAKALAKRFWPGPLTIVMKAKDFIPPIVLAGGDTVGLRCPQHPMTLELIRLAKIPFAAPSANPSGYESPKSADRVLEYFSGKIDAVVDGGECGIGVESTIIDMSAEPYRLLRAGALSAETIGDALVDNLKIVGITGGTGCGKTTALNQLSDLGAMVVDCDELYHELLASDSELILELGESFPGTVTAGKLDRKALGAVVFKSEDALNKLNNITHSFILAELQRRLRAFAMQGGKLVALDAIGLISSGLAQRCCFTVAVCASVEKRVERITARDSISREYALSRINAQRPDSYFKDNCSYVLYNNGSAEEFEIKCKKFFEEALKNG